MEMVLITSTLEVDRGRWISQASWATGCCWGTFIEFSVESVEHIQCVTQGALTVCDTSTEAVQCKTSISYGIIFTFCTKDGDVQKQITESLLKLTHLKVADTSLHFSCLHGAHNLSYWVCQSCTVQYVQCDVKWGHKSTRRLWYSNSWSLSMNLAGAKNWFGWDPLENGITSSRFKYIQSCSSVCNLNSGFGRVCSAN